MFVGDINIGEYYTAFGHGPKSHAEKSDIFDNVREVLLQADIVAGNLEAAISTYNFDPTKVESAVLRGNPEHADQLASAGFKVLQIANNHTVQHGKEAFQETAETLRSLNIDPIGIDGQDVVIHKVGSQSFGFLAASDVPDNTDIDQTSYQRLNSIFLEKVSRSVSRVDHLFIMLHWGLESSTKPLDYQREIITDLVNMGVRGVIGTHPHLFYEVWKQKDSIAAPSLGNFVFDLFWDPRLLASGILDIELSKDCISSCRIWPVTISDCSGKPVLSGDPVVIENQSKLYDLGENMNGEQLRKIIKFIKDFPKGNKSLKRQFIVKKLLGQI